MDPEMIQELLNGPSMKPPQGVTPNFDNPPSLKVACYVVTIASLVVATIAIGSRMFTKIRILRSVSREDYVAVASYLVFVGLLVPVFIMWEYTPGYHLWDVQLKFVKRWSYASPPDRPHYRPSSIPPAHPDHS